MLTFNPAYEKDRMRCACCGAAATVRVHRCHPEPMYRFRFSLCAACKELHRAEFFALQGRGEWVFLPPEDMSYERSPVQGATQ